MAPSLSSPWARVELGPSLPMPVYTAGHPWNAARIGALAIYCSDGRWGEAFDEFCHRHLFIPRYDRLALPGGPAWLVPREAKHDFCRAAWEQLEFLVHVHQLGRIVLIGHYGCAHYAEWLKREPDECLSVQTEDLRAAAAALREWFAGVKVESYLAMRRGNVLSFHEVSD